jgi:hypothetical protein
MKKTRLLCVLCMCAPLALEVSAAESPAQTGSPAAPAKGEAAGGSQMGHPMGQESSQAVSIASGGAKGRHAAAAASPRVGGVTPPHGAGLVARGRAARMNTVHPASTPGSLASTANRRPASRRAALNTAANSVASVRGGEIQRATTAVRLTGPPGVTSAARAPPSRTAATSAARPRGPSIGGPRAAGAGRLGGPAVGRTANNAIDGAQMHRKL